MMISIVVVLVGLGLTLTGLAIQPNSNPETSVQIVVWSMIVGGIALVFCGAMLAPRRKSPSGRKGDEFTKEWRFDKHRLS